MISRPHFRHLVEQARKLPPLPAAFVYPCSTDALQFALAGAFAGFLAPLLVGPEARIRDIANRGGIDISRLPIVDTPAEPRAAGIVAAGLARHGTVRALIKGNLGNDDLLAPVAAAESGLRGERRLSHAFFIDLPERASGMLLADALLNIAPNLAAKKDIVLNTIGLAHALGVATPNVAILAAMDGESPAFPSTRDAAALKTMAGHGMFRGAVVDGPLTADSALSAEAARANGVQSDVAGRPDILIAPTMEAASLVVRTMTGLTAGLAAGLVLGANIPIVAPARGDSLEVRMASCVLAAIVVEAGDRKGGKEAAMPAIARRAESAAHAAA